MSEMKIITTKFYFEDKNYYEIENLANRLDISKEELLAQFLTESISLMWDAFEYQAKKNKKIKALSEEYGIPIKELEKLKNLSK